MMNRTLLTTLIAVFSLPLAAQQDPSPDSLHEHVSILASDSLLGRGFGTVQGMEAALYIARQFEEAGVQPLNGSYLHPFNHRQGILNIDGTNVVGMIPGSDPDLKDEFIVLGAHYDHLGWKVENGDTVVYNGADDNASGTASIIEIGRRLAANRDSLGRSVIIAAFDGEESGLIGSTHFVEEPPVPLQQIKLMFSLDMVGMYEAHGGVDLHGIKNLNEAERMIGELSRTHQMNITKANGRTAQRTDTAPFGNIGIPTVHVFTGTESPYHQPEDEQDKLDYSGMSKIAGYMTDATLQLSRADRISDLPGPGEEGAAAQEEVFAAGIRILTGSSRHLYKDEFYEGKSIFAAGAGVYGRLRLTDRLALQPELLYQTGGSRHQEGTYRTHALTVPLNVQFTLAEQSYVRSFVQLGGYYSYHFGGKLGDNSIDYAAIYTPHEFGLTYGVGFEVMQVQVGLVVERGLNSILQPADPELSPVFPRSISFTIGWTF
ncbi:MAG: M28 family peptidase [Bacteroidales bacterium]